MSALSRNATSSVSSRDLPIQIVFVADPTRYGSLKNARETDITYWQRRFTETFTYSDFQWLKGAYPNAIFKEDDDSCHMQEFASISAL